MSALYLGCAPMPWFVQVIDELKRNAATELAPARARVASAPAAIGTLPVYRSDLHRSERSGRAFTWG